MLPVIDPEDQARVVARLAWRLRHSGKRCQLCGLTKPLTEFAKGSRQSDGLDPLCRECKRTKNREAYLARRHLDEA